MKLRVALAQISCRLGNIEANLEKHLSIINQARQAEADLLIFPELSLTGYMLQDLASEVALRLDDMPACLLPLLEASHDLDLVVGFVEEDRRSRFFIAGTYLSEGKVLHIHRKVFLPTYGMLDEKRYFAPGDSLRAFDTRFGRMGLAICEDFWHLAAPYLLWLDGADILIFTSAQPGHGVSASPELVSMRGVDQLLQTYAGLFTDFILYANRTGFEDGIFFQGGAAAVGPDGNFLVHAQDMQERLIFVEIDLEQIRRTRARLPVLRDERPDLVLRELERILKQEDRDD